MGYIAGKSGAVLIGSTHYKFGKWSFNMKAGTPKVTNFESNGYREIVSNIIEGTIEVDGPYDQGGMPLTAGNSYTVVLQWTSMVTLTGTAILSNLGPNLDVEDAGRVKCTFEVNGTFTGAIT